MVRSCRIRRPSLTRSAGPDDDRSARQRYAARELRRRVRPRLVQLEGLDLVRRDVVDLHLANELPVEPQVRDAGWQLRGIGREARAETASPEPDEAHAARFANHLTRADRIACHDLLARVELAVAE